MPVKDQHTHRADNQYNIVNGGEGGSNMEEGGQDDCHILKRQFTYQKGYKNLVWCVL